MSFEHISWSVSFARVLGDVKCEGNIHRRKTILIQSKFSRTPLFWYQWEEDGSLNKGQRSVQNIWKLTTIFLNYLFHRWKVLEEETFISAIIIE